MAWVAEQNGAAHGRGLWGDANVAAGVLAPGEGPSHDILLVVRRRPQPRHTTSSTTHERVARCGASTARVMLCTYTERGLNAMSALVSVTPCSIATATATATATLVSGGYVYAVCSATTTSHYHGL